MIVPRTRSLPTLFAVVHAALLVTPIHAEPFPVGAVRAAGIPGGLLVHLGCGDGALTAALRLNDSYLVHGLDVDAANVARARDHIRGLGAYGPVSIDTFDGARLPYADGLVNAVIVNDAHRVSPAELMRVLVPGGVLIDMRQTLPTTRRKPWPDDIDDWSHYLHDADNNAVAQDDRIGPPRSLQWIGTPRWARHHDKMASTSALVTAGGRLFYLFDEGSTASILLPSK